jgi:sensor domain CHASE-containing protein
MASSSSKRPLVPVAAISRRAIVAFFSLLFATLALAGTAVLSLTREQDRRSVEQSAKMVELAISTRRKELERTIRDYAFWGDAYANLHLSFDQDWAWTRNNFGETLYKELGIDGIYVVSPTNNVIYSVVNGEISGSDLGLNQLIVEQLLTTARTAPPGETRALTGFGEWRNTPAILAAAALSPGDDPRVKLAPGPSSVVIFVDGMTPATLAELATQYALPGLQSGPGLFPRADIRLPSEMGPLVLNWQPNLPGQEVRVRLLPWSLTAVFLIVVLAWLFRRRILYDSERIDIERQEVVVSERRFRDVAELASDWIWEADEHLRLTFLSEPFRAITGWDPEGMIGRRVSDFLVPDDAELVPSWIETRERLEGPLYRYKVLMGQHAFVVSRVGASKRLPTTAPPFEERLPT